MKPTHKRRLAGLLSVLLLVLQTPMSQAAAGTSHVNTTVQVVDGLTYQNTVSEGSGGRIESFCFTLSPDAAAMPIMVQGSGKAYGGGTIDQAVAQAQGRGYQVLGGINSDFFDTSSGVPIGIAIENGVYVSDSFGEAAVMVTDEGVFLEQSPRVWMSIEDLTHPQTLEVNYLNKKRHPIGGLYIMNSDFSNGSTYTTGDGVSVRLRPVGDSIGQSLTVNSTLSFEVAEVVVGSEPLQIGAGEYILTSHDHSGYHDRLTAFQVGDQVSFSTTCSLPRLSSARWVCGAGDVMISGGQLTDPAGWVYTNTGRAPRSAVGVRADGTMVIYAVDGRQAGYSAGLSQVDLAEEMLARGCMWAVNLDGGGSTAFSARLPGEQGAHLYNSPSDGSPRYCATYLLLAAKNTGSGTPSRLVVQPQATLMLAGTHLPLSVSAMVDEGLNVVSTTPPDDVQYTAQNGLGTADGGYFTAGNTVGTETITATAPALGISGQTDIQIVDRLTEFSLLNGDTGTAVEQISLRPGEQFQFSAYGSFWGRTALHSTDPIVWTLTDGLGQIQQNGLFTAAKQTASGTLTATAGGLSYTVSVRVTLFDDVPDGHWAADSIQFCYDKGITNGISENLFGTTSSIRRADFVKMLYAAAGAPETAFSPVFADVQAEDYYAAALTWAHQNGIASGVSAGYFAPQASLTREQAFTLLYRALPALQRPQPVASDAVLSQFSDQGSISAWAKQPTAALVGIGLVKGGDGAIHPSGALSRAEMAVLLHRLLS